MLRAENSTNIGDWIFQDILCHWGSIREIVTDNSAPFIKTLDYLAKWYHIYHIMISGYNSRANGIVERSHFDVRQALVKACDGDISKWNRGAYLVFWAERMTMRRRMSCLPYYAATGATPLIPLDITEATYLQPPPLSVLSMTDLIAQRAIALQKRPEQLEELQQQVHASCLTAAIRFEKKHF